MTNMQPILAALEKAIDSVTVKHFADKWGHSRQYIEKILAQTPDPEDAKNFPLRYFVEVLLDTGDLRALAIIADMVGMKLVPKIANPDGEDLRDESLQAIDATNIFIMAANNDKIPYSRLVEKRRNVAKEMDDVLERRKPEGVAPVGFVFGHISTPEGFKSVLIPNEDAEKKQ